MKTTGVVRRIDDLGRIVIPKEIRRTLRIRDGESLEIYVDKEMIALKKYSPMDDLEDISKAFVDAIYQSIQQNILVTDRDTFIAAAGNVKKKYIGKTISSYLEQAIEEREVIVQKSPKSIELVSGIDEEASFVIHPILVNGDSIGLVIILSSDKSITDLDEKIVQITSQFLEKHIEE